MIQVGYKSIPDLGGYSSSSCLWFYGAKGPVCGSHISDNIVEERRGPWYPQSLWEALWVSVGALLMSSNATFHTGQCRPSHYFLSQNTQNMTICFCPNSQLGNLSALIFTFLIKHDSLHCGQSGSFSNINRIMSHLANPIHTFHCSANPPSQGVGGLWTLGPVDPSNFIPSLALPRNLALAQP